ncbi:MAG: hypothetical protein NVSMB26_21860 [Beijerinckiaceae bacterium]
MSLSALASLARPAAPGSISLGQVAHLFSEGIEPNSWEKLARRQRRQALFRENLLGSLRRMVLAGAYALRPDRVGGLVPACSLLLRELVARREGLPDPRSALSNPDGLCGIAADLSVARLIEAYERGLFPLSHAGPVKWWAPRTRCVADPRAISASRTTLRHAKRGTFKLTFDRDFDAVIAACAAPRPGHVALTWITPKIMWAYAALHDAGFAHSYEVWDRDGRLVAGGYGVAIGRVFVGESMFTRTSGAGALGLAMLHRHLAHWGFALHDAKLLSPHLRDLGYIEMPRETYRTYLSGRLSAARAGPWRVIPALTRA